MAAELAKVADAWILETIAFKTSSIFLSDKDCTSCLHRLMLVWKHLLALHPNHPYFDVWNILLQSILQSFETKKEAGLLQLLKQIGKSNINIKRSVQDSLVKFLHTKVVLCHYNKGKIRKARNYLRDKENQVLYLDKLKHLLKQTDSTYPDEFDVKNLQKHLIPFVSESVKKHGQPKLYQLIHSILEERNQRRHNTSHNVSTKESSVNAALPQASTTSSCGKDSTKDSLEVVEQANIGESQPKERTPKRSLRLKAKKVDSGGESSPQIQQKRQLRSSDDDNTQPSTPHIATNVKELRSRNVDISPSPQSGTTNDGINTQPSTRHIVINVRDLRSRNVDISSSLQRSLITSKSTVEKSPQNKDSEFMISPPNSQPTNQSESDKEESSHIVENELSKKSHGPTASPTGPPASPSDKPPVKTAVHKQHVQAEEDQTVLSSGQSDKSSQGSQDPFQSTSKKPLATVYPVRKAHHVKPTLISPNRKPRGSLRARPSPSILEIANEDEKEAATSSRKRLNSDDPNGKRLKKKKKVVSQEEDDEESLTEDFVVDDEEEENSASGKIESPPQIVNEYDEAGPSSRNRAVDDANSIKRTKKKKKIIRESDEGESLIWSDDNDNDDEDVAVNRRSVATKIKLPLQKSSYFKHGRVKFTAKEEQYIVQGVERYGVGNWANILQHFKFHPSRTNVSLKDKYRTMKRQGHF